MSKVGMKEYDANVTEHEANETADEPFPLRRMAPPAIPGLLLVWMADVPAYRAFPIGSAPTTIGRDPSCVIPLSADQAVSRQHAQVSFDAATRELVVRDAASRHGVYVDAKRIAGEHRVSLDAGARCVVRAGASLFVASADISRYVADIEAGNRTLFDASADSVVGPAMRALRAKVKQAARSDRPILIQGETGAGKERIARLFHTAGPRAHAPYIVYNCASLERNLADADLFGYAKGAFTGAVADRKGMFESADTGVLFLDEIAELPLEVQPKLLHVLEEGWVRPVGGSAERRVRVDVAVVAATHDDLRVNVANGRFREDLYERLRVREVRLPPLRERPEEIPFLIEFFRARSPTAPRASALMVEACLRHDWPGNVRALQTAVDQAIENALADDAPSLELAAGALDTRVAAALTTTTIAGPSRTLSPREQRDEEFAHLVETKHGGNVSAAARELGIKTSTGHDMWKRAVARRRGGGDT